MSYSIDRSSRSRGVGAVAARDLRHDDGGGALVRTGRGPVVILASRENLGAFSPSNPFRNQVTSPSGLSKALQWEKKNKPKTLDIRRTAARGTRKPTRKPTAAPPRRRPSVRVKIKKVTSPTLSPAVAPESMLLAPPSTSSSQFTGGGGGGGGSSWAGGGGGGGGGGEDFGPSPDASQEEMIQEQEAALEPGSEGEKPPMSTGMKLGIAAAIGWAAWSMWKGG